MTLRAKIIAYLVAIHVVLAAISFLLLRENKFYLLLVEAFFALSICLGVLLLRAFFVPLELIRTGAELMAERDFTSQFSPVGQPEMDDLIEVYNRMSRSLREERLKAQEQHYFLEQILAATPIGILTLDFEGRISSLNRSASALLSLPEGEALGKKLAELPAPAGLAAELASVPLGEPKLLSSGRRRLKVSRAELFDRGFPRHFLSIEELTGELRASEKAAYGKLIRMMSHEVNNSVGPVSSLLDSFSGYSDQLKGEDREDFESALGVAITRLERLSAFVGGFASMVRLPPPERRPCDLRRLLEEILILLRPQLEQRKIRVSWQSCEELPEIALDRNQIEQVLVNVLKNAMESIEENGTIGLRLGKEGGRSVLCIADSGKGIPEEVRALLFTPFFSTKRDGRGLGLTLIQEILSEHGCDFGLENRKEGQGAELWVAF